MSAVERAGIGLALGLIAVSAMAQNTPRTTLPAWPHATTPVADGEVGVRATLHLEGSSAVVEGPEGQHPVANAAQVTAGFDGMLRGYRRRYGLRRSPEGVDVRGGTGRLEARIVTQRTLPLRAIARWIDTGPSYSSWARSASLVVVLPSGEAGEVPVAFVERGADPDVTVGPGGTVATLVTAIAAQRTIPPRTRVLLLR